MNTSELRTKLQKYSATQLISKMEKGVENEEEKNIIIDILVKRGKDVTPYQDKTPEQIKEDSKIDQKMKEESKGTKEPKPTKEKKIKKESSPKEGSREVDYIDENFKAGDVVVTNKDSGKIPAGTKATVIKTRFLRENEDFKFAVLQAEDGKKFGRVLKFIEKV